MHLTKPGSVISTAFRSMIFPAMSIMALSFVATSAHAQLDRGTITGTLRDSRGSAVAHATVTVRNVDTGIVEKVTTNDDGTYQVLALNPGTYTVEATAAGFGVAKNTGIEIHVKSRAEVDFTLQVGS